MGHANASRVFDGYLATVGHGGVMNMNIPPDHTGRMNQSVVDVMYEAGAAINDTFYRHSAGYVSGVSGACGPGLAIVDVRGEFDFVVSMEDLSRGQRIGNYSIDFQRRGSAAWEVLVPPRPATGKFSGNFSGSFSDRPDGHDPRDSRVGHKRIDVPIVATSGPAAIDIARVRFNCIRVVERAERVSSIVHLRNFSLHKKRVPWEFSPPRERAGASGNGGRGMCSGVTATGMNISYLAPPNSKQVEARS